MIRRAPALAALLAAFVLPSAAALAQDEWEEIPQRLERSMYLQLGGVWAFENFDDGISGKNSGGVDIRAGLRTSKWTSVEAQFHWLRGMEPDGNQSGDDWTTTFNLRIYPVSFKDGEIQPYLLLGAGASSFKRNLGGCTGPGCPVTARVYGFSSRWGGGVDVYLTDKIAVSVDFTYVWVGGTPVKDLDYMSTGIGLIYRFY